MDADAEADATDGDGAVEPGPTGPPPEMAESRGELTPMMAQYYTLCEQYDDALVLFQVGDFYEAFCDAAETVARACEVTLTQREDSTGQYRMAGVPVDNAATYVESLLSAGHRVAVADQVQDPDEASGVVDRAVTRVVTPGTVTDDELLAPGSANYVACLASGPAPDPEHAADHPDSLPDATDTDHPPGAYAVAFVDVSTGELTVAGGDWATVREEVERFGPAELLVDPRLSTPALETDPTVRRGAHDPAVFGLDRAAAALADHVGPPSLAADRAELRAVGALLAYAEYTQGGTDGRLGHVSRLRRYDPDEYLRLDATATRSLELFETRSTGDGPTLRGAVDGTVSAPGRRRLTAWLRQPLVDRAAIERRHGAVETLVEAPLVREDLREALSAVYDLERLVTRTSRARADARDLRSLRTTLAVVPDVLDALGRLAPSDGDAGDDGSGPTDTDARPLLVALRDGLDEMADVRELVEAAIQSDPPTEITEGGVIREGFDDDLDDLRATERAGREWVADLEARERERTGIDSLSVGYNDVHGYYIEVTNPNLDRVPEDYTRRQTLKNSERFYTPELKRREDEILGAAERADARELELFREVRASVAAEADRLRAVADRLATLDALVGFAQTAVDHDYRRPEMGADGVAIEGGRHPVVERTRAFVPNDTHLDERPIALVTGPNMSGKSTYMRQVALIAVLAQAGGFVPADRARLPVLDGVYTRVGASDDIAGGQSTFMREMTELTTILHAATEDSLVLLDEVGRGTSTVDGRSIARSVTEFLHDEVSPYTLFATHYHELTDLAADLPGVQTLHFTAERTDQAVTFRYDVREGAASSSYGVEIARMAGVPDPVVERAREYVERETAGTDPGDGGDPGRDDPPAESEPGPPPAAENGSGDPGDSPAAAGESGPESPETTADPDPLAERLAAVDLATTTPLEALNLLAELEAMATADGEDG